MKIQEHNKNAKLYKHLTMTNMRRMSTVILKGSRIFYQTLLMTNKQKLKDPKRSNLTQSKVLTTIIVRYQRPEVKSTRSL